MKIRIDGTRIYLTAIGEQDTDRVIAWRNKPFVRKWFLYREEFTREGHQLRWSPSPFRGGYIRTCKRRIQ